MAKKVELGQVVRDKLTGQQGTVICRAEWLYGCVRVTVQPFGEKDGKAFEWFTTDEPQCEIIKPEKAEKAKSAHGPRPEPTRATAPR